MLFRSVRVLTTNQNDFTTRNSKCTTCPQWILKILKTSFTYSHPDLVNVPVVLLNFKDLYGIVYFLLGTSEETAKCVYKLIVDCASRQVVTFVFHGSCLHPFVFSHNILFHGVESLLAAEPTKYKHITLAKRDSMCVPGLTHRLFRNNLIFCKSIDTSIFFRGRTTTSNKDFKC